MLKYDATNIAGLDLSFCVAIDQLRLMGSFGISNYITGVMLILLGWKARHLVLTMLGVIPAAYFIGTVGIKLNTAAYTTTQAEWGGVPMVMAYMIVCIVTFLAGAIVAKRSVHV